MVIDGNGEISLGLLVSFVSYASMFYGPVNFFANMSDTYQNTLASAEKILDLYEEISVNEKVTLMNELFDQRGECFFTDLITRKGNVLDVFCAFMAILEAVKFKVACIYQNKMFGDIKICPYKAA